MPEDIPRRCSRVTTAAVGAPAAIEGMFALPRWIGTGVDVTPWRATQRAVLDTLRRDQQQ